MRGASVLLLVCLLSSAPQGAEAQRLSYSKGQPVYPAYEGWERNSDGSFDMLFGYMNQNWEQLVPADFGEEEELVWTLRANGQEYRAYGTLRADLYTDNMIIMSETGALGAGTSSPEIRANVPPEIELEGGVERSARVGEVLTLAAVVTDDGQPTSVGFFSGGTDSEEDAVEDDVEDAEEADAEEEDNEPTPRELLERALGRGTASGTVSKRLGLHYTWFVYRGPGEAVEFDPPQTKTWEDTRPFANSPWTVAWVVPEAPEDGRWVSEVTFSEPGTYVLRGRADDGGLYADVEVTVRVQSTVF